MDDWERPIAEAMRQRAAAKLLPEAFELFEGSPLVPDSTKHQWLRDNLDPAPDPSRLRYLVRLPVCRWVTTNFDWAFATAWASERDTPLRPADHDRALTSAIYWPGPYLAQVHGSLVAPELMVLSKRQFDALPQRTAYREFLAHLFTTFDCLFLGFSFDDPAIVAVLEEMVRLRGVEQRTRHMAMIPHEAQGLRAKLASLNVEVTTYSSENDHAVLWGAIAEVARRPPVASNDCGAQSDSVSPIPSMLASRQMLAAAYARVRAGGRAGPVRNQVLDGLVLSILASKDGLMAGEIRQLLANAVHAPAVELEQANAEALRRLESLGLASSAQGRWFAIAPATDPSAEDFEVLTAGALHRLRVREHIEPLSGDNSLIRTALERLVIGRGLQLGAQLAGVSTPGGVSFEAIRSSLGDEIGDATRVRAFVAAIHNLLVDPSGSESAVLSELGRLAFGLDVLLNQIHSAVLSTEAFPNRLFLDASLALPLLVPGYPLRPAYRGALSQLQHVLRDRGQDLEVVVGGPFLNEIISHRRLAIRQVHEMGLTDPGRLRRHFTLAGQDFGNVFISAYATAVSRDGRQIDFDNWLTVEAPYETEQELATHLARMGIGSTVREIPDGSRLRRFHQIVGALNAAYGVRAKAPMLVDHEALQLLLLEELPTDAPRTIFVTADGRLRRAITEHSELSHLAPLLLSHVAFVGLVDFLIGVNEADDSLARLFWGMRVLEGHDEARVILRGYFTDLALNEYRSALDLDLESLVTRYVTEAEGELAARGRSFADLLADDVSAATRFLDRKADSFYRDMSEEIARRDRER